MSQETVSKNVSSEINERLKAVMNSIKDLGLDQCKEVDLIIRSPREFLAISEFRQRQLDMLKEDAHRLISSPTKTRKECDKNENGPSS